MRHLAVSVLFVGLIGLAFAGVRPLSGLAQESTPMADMASMPASAVGLTPRVLARVEPATAAGQELQLVRIAPPVVENDHYLRGKPACAHGTISQRSRA
jgi:hypothetical protein